MKRSTVISFFHSFLNKPDPRSVKTWIALGTGVLFLSLFFSLFPGNDARDLFFQWRGMRNLDAKYCVITLSDEDIEALGGWPITRDYFGYLIHILHANNARVIGMDILFDHENTHYPEFDRALARFIESSQTTVLPCVLQTRSESIPGVIEQAEGVTWPASAFREHCAGVGFSNLGNDAKQRSVPAVAQLGDSLVYSFGVALAAAYLDARVDFHPEKKELAFYGPDENSLLYHLQLDPEGQALLNHFGGFDEVRHLGFVELMKLYESQPDSLNFENQLVLVAATATSLPVVKQTPFSQPFPASLIHLTLAENIIEKQALRKLSLAVTRVLLFVFFSLLLCVSFVSSERVRVIASVALLMAYGLFAFAAFAWWQWVLPDLSVFLGGCLVIIGRLIFGLICQRTCSSSENRMLQEEMTKTTQALHNAEGKLNELQKQLEQEDREKSQLSEQTLQLAREKRTAVDALEKHLRDLEAYQNFDLHDNSHAHEEIVFSANGKMADVITKIRQVSSDDIAVLICGETGTGKELIARAIHRGSKRNKGPFVAVNCGALPETLLESELFGHEKGSFTGATVQRKGRFEMANGGTLFLDEITETSPAFQSRLLRVLQEKTIERVGGEKSISVNVRIITASNKDIRQAVENDEFRADVYFRINGFQIALPPLRERKPDIALLATHFIGQYGQEASGFSESAMAALVAYPWPGNVRELENAVRRGALLASHAKRHLIQLKDLPDEIQSPNLSMDGLAPYRPFETQILELLRQFGFSRSSIGQTAKVLGNRDRGTITEYFRGICFEAFAGHQFDMDQTIREIASSEDPAVLKRVESKISGYLENLSASPNAESLDLDQVQDLPPAFQGLPKKYHASLKQILIHLNQQK